MDSVISRPVIPARHPLLRVATAFPIAGFTGALATDIAYARTANMMWADFSSWLLAAGMVMGGLAVLAAVVDAAAARRGRGAGLTWPGALGGLAVLAVAFLNTLVHGRDAWTSVVPLGLTLSAVTVLLMLATAVLGASAASRRQMRAVQVRS